MTPLEQLNTKRIIYVGKPRIGEDQIEVRFGMTGEVTSMNGTACSFKPDGTEIEFALLRRELYQADQDATRWCPCP